LTPIVEQEKEKEQDEISAPEKKEEKKFPIFGANMF
jgi:hypothetical protein